MPLFAQSHAQDLLSFNHSTGRPVRETASAELIPGW